MNSLDGSDSKSEFTFYEIFQKRCLKAFEILNTATFSFPPFLVDKVFSINKAVPETEINMKFKTLPFDSDPGTVVKHIWVEL